MIVEARTWTCARCKVAFEAAVSASPNLDLLCSDCTVWTHTPGAVVRAFRARHGLTQAGLAALLDTSKRTIETWEYGDRRPPAYLPRALRDVERELAEAGAPRPMQSKRPEVG